MKKRCSKMTQKLTGMVKMITDFDMQSKDIDKIQESQKMMDRIKRKVNELYEFLPYRLVKEVQCSGNAISSVSAGGNEIFVEGYFGFRVLDVNNLDRPTELIDSSDLLDLSANYELVGNKVALFDRPFCKIFSLRHSEDETIFADLGEIYYNASIVEIGQGDYIVSDDNRLWYIDTAACKKFRQGQEANRRFPISALKIKPFESMVEEIIDMKSLGNSLYLVQESNVLILNDPKNYPADDPNARYSNTVVNSMHSDFIDIWADDLGLDKLAKVCPVNEQYMIVIGVDGRVVRWDLGNSKTEEIMTLRSNKFAIIRLSDQSVALSDGTFVYVVEDITDPKWTHIHNRKAEGHFVESLAALPNGRFVVGGASGNLQVFGKKGVA
ncbi:MAG: hypothetical protein NTW50_05185 [Candidatus Berkelbacteria bacterium]|nr:hypothetical protein [Candidatus Berkelbacteria bacterium]